MRSPIFWYGGKFYMRNFIIDLFPEHKVYVEPFGGAAQILFHKPPSPLEVYNDIHKGLYCFFKVLRSPEKAMKLQKQLKLTPYSRTEHTKSKEDYKSGVWDGLDEIEKARQFYTNLRQGFSGIPNSGWSYGIKYNKACMGFVNSVDRLYECSERFRRVQVECQPYQEILKKYDNPETLFYLDPPYPHQSRKTKDVYDHEMTDEDHQELLSLIKELKGYVILSTYPNKLYSTELCEWYMHTRKTTCYAVGKAEMSGLKGENGLSNHKRLEVVYTNYKPMENTCRSVEQATLKI